MANEEVYPLVYSHIHVMIVAAPHFEVRAEHHYLYPIPRIVFKLLQYTSTWLTSPVNSVKLMLTLLLSLASKPKKASLAKKSRARNKKKDRNCYRCGERGHMARDCFAGRLQKVLKLFQHASRKKSQNKKSQRSN